ncbi:MAG: LysR family transcriptional regulator [Paracoccaceae bacterium]
MDKTELANLPLEWVRAYEAAARLGSFTMAARETGLTQAAISQRIGNLEARLGTRLFLRHARRVVLTVEGEAWLPYVSGALAALQNSAEDLFATRRRKITLSASASVTDLWLARRLAGRSLNAGDALTFQTMVLSAESGPQDLSVVKIRYGTGDGSEPYRARLYVEAISPVAAPSLVKGQQDWRHLPRIGVTGPRPGWADWSRFSADPATPVPVLRFDSFAPALSAARAGLGVMLGSLPLCQEDLASGALIRLTPQTLLSDQSYWMLAGRDALSPQQWAMLCSLFVQTVA